MRQTGVVVAAPRRRPGHGTRIHPRPGPPEMAEGKRQPTESGDDGGSKRERDDTEQEEFAASSHRRTAAHNWHQPNPTRYAQISTSAALIAALARLPRMPSPPP